MPFLFRKTRMEKSIYQLCGHLYPDNACAQAQHVHIVMLYTLVR